MKGKDDTSSRSTGFQGEEVAARYLEKEGYEILERNYRGGSYELDIIAACDGTIVFCEVKTARTGRFGPAVTWVTPEKIRHIATAAAEYIHTHETVGRSFRFDVIGLEVRDGVIEINHIIDAFTAPEDSGER